MKIRKDYRAAYYIGAFAVSHAVFLILMAAMGEAFSTYWAAPLYFAGAPVLGFLIKDLKTACKTAICLSLAPLSYILYLWMAAGMLRVNPFTILQELLEAVMVFCVPSVIIVYGASQLPKWNRERKREKQRRQTQQRIEKNAQKLKPKKAKYSVKDR